MLIGFFLSLPMLCFVTFLSGVSCNGQFEYPFSLEEQIISAVEDDEAS